MNQFEDDLQNEIERGNASYSGKDAEAYKLLFQALEKPPHTNVSSNFADKVIQRTLAKEQKKESSKEILWLIAGSFALLVFMLIAFAYASVAVNFSVLKPLWDYKGLILLAATMIVVFGRIERQIFQRQIQSDPMANA